MISDVLVIAACVVSVGTIVYQSRVIRRMVRQQHTMAGQCAFLRALLDFVVERTGTDVLQRCNVCHGRIDNGQETVLRVSREDGSAMIGHAMCFPPMESDAVALDITGA